MPPASGPESIIMRKIKVYGGNGFVDSKQCRMLVGAYSQVEAVKYLITSGQRNFTLHYFRGYWCETGNDVELKTVGLGEVWVYPDVNGRDGLKCIWRSPVAQAP